MKIWLGRRGYEIEGEVGGGVLIKSPFGLKGGIEYGFFSIFKQLQKKMGITRKRRF